MTSNTRHFTWKLTFVPFCPSHEMEVGIYCNTSRDIFYNSQVSVFFWPNFTGAKPATFHFPTWREVQNLHKANPIEKSKLIRDVMTWSRDLLLIMFQLCEQKDVIHSKRFTKDCFWTRSYQRKLKSQKSLRLHPLYYSCIYQ